MARLIPHQRDSASRNGYSLASSCRTVSEDSPFSRACPAKAYAKSWISMQRAFKAANVLGSIFGNAARQRSSTGSLLESCCIENNLLNCSAVRSMLSLFYFQSWKRLEIRWHHPRLATLGVRCDRGGLRHRARRADGRLRSAASCERYRRCYTTKTFSHLPTSQITVIVAVNAGPAKALRRQLTSGCLQTVGAPW